MSATLDAPKTLADLKGEMRLTGNEKFSADLQDRMGLHLLKRRGYDKFIAGTLSITGFGLNLAKEWASFPVLKATKGAHRQVSRGQSYYAGDGVNKALVSAADVETALTKALTMSRNAPVAVAAPSVEESVAKPLRPSVGGFLASMWAKLNPKSATPSLPVLATRGDPVVFNVQSQMKDRGYYLNGFLDGIDGEKTRDAIAAIRKDNGMGDGGIDQEFLARLPTFGKRPVGKERQDADFAKVKAHAPDLAAPVGTMWKVGAGLLGLGGANAANTSGLLDTVKDAGDKANDVLGTVQTALGTIAAAIQFLVEHWTWFAIGFGLFLLFKAASFALNLIIRIRQAFF